MKKVRVLLVDDHPATRQGIALILAAAPDIEFVGEAETGLDAQQMVVKHRPDVLLLDLIMPDVKPYEVEKWVRTNYPETITLILTGHEREYFLAQAVEEQVAGFLTKRVHPEQLINAIRRAAQGESLFSEEQFESAARWKEKVGAAWSSLSEREKMVLCLLAEGMDNGQIATKLCVGLKGVKNYVWRILNKLHLHTRSEAIVWTIENIPEAWRDAYRK